MNPHPTGHRTDHLSQMSSSPPSSAGQPNPPPPSPAPSYEPVGIFWDYGQPILISPHISRLNPGNRELRSIHQRLRIQHYRKYPRASKPVRGGQHLQGIPPAPRQILSQAILPPVRTPVMWRIPNRSVHPTPPVSFPCSPSPQTARTMERTRWT